MRHIGLGLESAVRVGPSNTLPPLEGDLGSVGAARDHGDCRGRHAEKRGTEKKETEIFVVI